MEAAAQQANRKAVSDKEKDMKKQVKESDRTADHPPQNANKKIPRLNPPVKKDIATKKAVKRSEQVSKDAASRWLTRQETKEVPETEGE